MHLLKVRTDKIIKYCGMIIELINLYDKKSIKDMPKSYLMVALRVIEEMKEDISKIEAKLKKEVANYGDTNT